MGGTHRLQALRLTSLLPAPAAAAARTAARLAAAAGWQIFLVGGSVRDLLLARPLQDLDLLVLGDAVALAQKLAEALSGEASCHARFGTASVRLPEVGLRLDLAAARRERYAGAGRLPDVAPGDLAADLARRDFTINAMAWRLGAGGGDRLLDPLGGQSDLQAGLLRVLHPQSFRDDPTRAFRAVRLAARLGFGIERATAAAMDQAVALGGVRGLSPARLGREVRLLADEDDWPSAMSLAARHGLLRGLQPTLQVPPAAVCGRLHRLLAVRPEAARLIPILAALQLQAAPEPGTARLQWPAGVASRAQDLAAAGAGLLSRLAGVSSLQALLDRAPDLAEAADDLLALLQAFLPDAASRRALAQLRLRRQRLSLEVTATDLKAAGVPAGPQLGRRLAALRRRLLVGGLRGRRAQLAWALSTAALEGDTGTPNRV